MLYDTTNIKNYSDMVFVLIRDPENYYFNDAIYDSTGNIIIYTAYDSNNVKLLGVDVKNKQEMLYYHDASVIRSYNNDKFSIIRFVDVSDSYLLRCSVEMPIESLPLYIYKDDKDKLVQIILYENQNNKEVNQVER